VFGHEAEATFVAVFTSLQRISVFAPPSDVHTGVPCVPVFASKVIRVKFAT
jgi:hypothetical protein